MDDALHRVLAAVDFAAEKHRHQRRKDRDATPYINHPIALARVLTELAGVHDVEVIIAALLHDTIEDTDTTAAEIAAEFGEAIAAIVVEVTDDQALPKQERKRLQVAHAPHISGEAKLVKLADKLCNLRDMRARPPDGWDADRCREYFEWAARVVAGLRGTNAALEAALDELFLAAGIEP